MEWRSHSIQATTPSTMGLPLADTVCAMPANLSGSLEASRRQTGSWSAARMLTQKAPHPRSLAQLLDPRSGKKAISGGSSDTEVNEPTTMAIASPPDFLAVTTQIPVGYCPSTWRYHFGSMIEGCGCIGLSVGEAATYADAQVSSSVHPSFRSTFELRA